MSGRTRDHRSSRRLLLAAVGFALVSGILSAGPVAAHNFTKSDGNDSRGRLDLRSVSVSHTATGVAHKVTTYNSWTSRSLGADSFFIIQIDKNHDQRYERCAFIFFASRLRGSLTNCRRAVHPIPARFEDVGHGREDHDPEESDGQRVLVGGGEPLGRTRAVRGKGVRRFRPEQLPRHPSRHGAAGGDHDDRSAPRLGGLDGSRLHLPVLALGREFRDQVVDRPGPPSVGTWTTVARGRVREQRAPTHRRRRGRGRTIAWSRSTGRGTRRSVPSRRVYIPRTTTASAQKACSPTRRHPFSMGTPSVGAYSPDGCDGTLTYTLDAHAGDCSSN